MSTPSGGGHAVHLISSGGSREQPGKNVVTGPKQAKQKGQINEPPPPAVPVHPAHAHILSHTDLDPRVALSGAGGGGHHGPPPPRKVEAIGMIDAWTRMPPQYASQAASLDPTAFMSSSPAAYYHPPPVSPYGAAAAYASIGGIKTECHHGSAAAAGAPWSNGTDVASYFGYPPTSADFHHHHHHHHAADPAGMFGNGYPTAAGTYTSNFGYSPFPTPTHTAPGSAVSPQDYTGWAATTTTTPHDLVERAPHQKNPYGGGTTAGDYYSYDIIGAAPSMMTAGLDMGPPAAAAVPPITVNCDERVKSLGTRIENLSIAGSNEQHQHHLNESGQVDAVTDGRVDPSTTARVSHQEGSAVERHRKGGGGESSAADSKDTTEPNNNNNNNDAADDADSGNGGGKTSANNENHAAAAATGGEVSLPGASTCSGGGGPPAHHPQQQQQVSDNESVPAADSTTTIEESATTTESSIHLSNWNWIDEEVKDWSASPPPAATLPSGVEQDNEDVVDRTDDDDDDWNQLLFKDDIDSVGDHLTTQEQQEQTSAHLLQDLKRKNNYNPSELDLRVEGARFFVIKSYSEDDVHRSIKYSIWCSTEHGNKKLDQAFRHQKNLPIYLFYSVNGSGHFCGMAQMTSSVDYDTLTGVWAQDKWKGKFNVKWIYVKDIPNPELRHIRLENNENKPVTNSRDTQEIPPDKGRQVLEIMHKYRHETSLFDDFVYYEDMEHKREAERDLHDSAGPRTSAAAGAATSSSSSSTFRNFPPKRKGDESRDGYPSNGNHHHHHHHRDNHHHHHGKDYRDPRDHATSRRSTARSFGGAGYNRDDRPFGAGYRSNETDSPQPPPAQRSSNHHVGRSFTTCTSSYKRDRDGGGGSNAGNERTLFSNRYNTQLRNDSAHWRS